MPLLKTITRYCDERTNRREIPDYPGAFNGLQIENNGEISKIGASVDASAEVFEKAIARKIDFLIVHHGPFWGPVAPIVGVRYQKYFTAMKANLAVYGSHLPLDKHPEIGNNVLVAKQLGLTPTNQFAPYEGVPIGWYCDCDLDRTSLRSTLEKEFPQTTAMEYGASKLKRIGIITGSGADSLPMLASHGIDTLITGECSQHHFAMTQELGINLYICGHYDTEVLAVQALAEEVSAKYELPWEFVPTDCPL